MRYRLTGLNALGLIIDNSGDIRSTTTAVCDRPSLGNTEWGAVRKEDRISLFLCFAVNDSKSCEKGGGLEKKGGGLEKKERCV